MDCHNCFAARLSQLLHCRVQWLGTWLLLTLFSELGCKPLDRPLTLREGELCETDAECRSGFCENSKIKGTRICCQYACGSNEACTPQGMDCKDCDTLQCAACDPAKESCNAVEQGLDQGALCSADQQCITSSCDRTVLGDMRCCDSQCVPEGRGCGADGACVELAATTDLVSSKPPVSVAPEVAPSSDSTSSVTPAASAVAPGQAGMCGDNVTNGTEECDGELNCSSKCQLVVCGNHRLDESEGCDPPEEGKCYDNCQPMRCGDGIVNDNEECESPSSPECNQECLNVVCGDGRIDAEDGEGCDPPMPGSCSTTCTPYTCGNDVREDGEGCDPPDNVTCDQFCQIAGCGDGTVDANEECEPDQSGCSEQCRLIGCGNGYVEVGEECEPDGMNACSPECRSIVCGNQRIDDGETCDPPGDRSCDAECQKVECGDGILSDGEQCEPDGPNDEFCTSTCITVGNDGLQYMYTFDSDVQDWLIQSTDPAAMEEDSTLTFDSQNGDVSPGCLKVTVPFYGHNQKIEFQANQDPALDLRGHVLNMRLRIQRTADNEDADLMGAKMFAKSGENWSYASGEWMYFGPMDGWVDLTLDIDNPLLVPSEFFPDVVRQIGIELRTPDPVGSIVYPTTLYVDSVSY